MCTNHADIEVMIWKSRHIHAASRCAKMVFGYDGKSYLLPNYDEG